MQSSTPNDPDRFDDQDTTRRISFLNGRWLEHSQLSIGVEDMGFRQGVVAVERWRTYHGSIFAADSHLDRWQKTTERLAIDGLPSRTDVLHRLRELLDRNLAWIDRRGDVGITMVATPGTNVGNATFLLHLNPLDHDRIDSHRRSGQSLVLTDVVQPDCASWPRAIKTRARIHYYLADLQARAEDSDAVGVLLDQDGSVTETSIANLAIVSSGLILSPPADRVLGGITQQVIEKLAGEDSLCWEKRAISTDQLVRADEVLLMGTDGGIWFAHSVSGKTIGNGKPGPIYERLRKRFDEMVAKGSRLAQ